MHTLSYDYLHLLSEKMIHNEASTQEIAQYKEFLDNWDDSKQFNMFNASTIQATTEKISH